MLSELEQRVDKRRQALLKREPSGGGGTPCPGGVGDEGDVQYLTSHTDHLEQLGFAEFVKLEIAKAGGI
jgi:hypothetical protein